MRLPFALASLLAGCISVVPPPGQADSMRSEPLPPPAPSGVPEAQEAEAALAAGSNSALIRFLARHPADPQAGRIRQALAARTRPDSANQIAAVGADAEVIAAFDAARLSDSAGEWKAFQDRYRSHPLAAEADRWR